MAAQCAAKAPTALGERLRARAELLGIIVEITPLTTIDTVKKTIDVAFELEKKSRIGGKIHF